MAQAVTALMPDPDPTQPALTISALAARWMQLANTPFGEGNGHAIVDEQRALEQVMLWQAPQNDDESLTLLHVIRDDLDDLASWDDDDAVEVCPEHMRRLAQALDGVCRIMQERGARNLLG